MPLKHLTETVLIAVLAVATIVTGIAVATLPPLPQGLMPSLLILVAALLYGIGLHPLLKRDRSDYEFRLLHLAPAAIVAVWMAIQIAALRFPGMLAAHRLWTWGWALPGVLLTFLLLAAFVLQVIRRRVPRLAILGGLFALFLALAAAGEGAGGRSALQAALWRRVWSTVAWSAPEPPAPPPSVATSSASSRRPVVIRGRDGLPPRLSTSGPEHIALVAVLFLAAYCGALHARARRRALA